MRKPLVASLAMALAVAACSASGTTTTGATTTLGTAPATTAAPSTTQPGSTTTAPPATTTSTTVGSTTTTTPGPTTLPGEPIDIGPAAGDVLAVVGVAHDDVLNVRKAPGTDQEIVARLAPTFDDIVALGAARRLPSSIWYEVDVDGTRGWVSSRFVAYLGLTDDITSQVVAQLGGDIPVADSMEELGQIVAESQASTDPPSTITVTVAPTVGDLGEITLDVVGLGDDALFGVRLHVFGQSEDGGLTFSLKSVEQTLLCGRGVTADGLCP